MRTKLLLALAGILLGVTLYFVYQRYQLAAAQLSISTSRDIAAQAALDFRDNPLAVERTALAAIESIRRQHTAQNDGLLRASMGLLLRKAMETERDLPIRWVGVSADGHRVAAALDLGTVYVFDAQSGKEIAHLAVDSDTRATAFSRDGRWVATASAAKKVRIYNVDTGKESAPLQSVEGVNAVAFSLDNRLVATAGEDHQARVFEIATGREIAHMIHEGPALCVAFSTDSRRLASGSYDQTARVLDLQTGIEIAKFPIGNGVLGVLLSANGKRLAVRTFGPSAMVFDVEKQAELARLDQDADIETLAFSADGSRAATGGTNGKAYTFDTQTGKRLAEASHGKTIHAVAFSPNGRWLATAGEDGVARLINAETGVERARLEHPGPVHSVAFSDDAHYLVTGSEGKYVLAKGINSGITRVYEMSGSDEERVVTHDDRVYTVGLSRDGKRVAVSGVFEHPVSVMDSESAREIARFPQNLPLRDMRFSSDGRRLASIDVSMPAGGGRILRLYDVDGRHELLTIPYPQGIDAIGLSGDGSRLVAGGAFNETWVLDTASGKDVFHSKPPSGPNVPAYMRERITEIAVSEDGRTAATGSSDKIARVLEVETGKPIAQFTHAAVLRVLAMSADGRWLATFAPAEPPEVSVFDVRASKQVFHRGGLGNVEALALSDDGRYLATSAEDTTAHVFDLASGLEIAAIGHADFQHPYSLPTGVVGAMHFSPDGRQLVALIRVSERSLHVASYPLTTADLVSRACALLSRNLTPEEWKHYLPSVPYALTCSQTR